MNGKMRFGEFLVHKGYLTDSDVSLALKKQSEVIGSDKFQLGNYIVALDMLSEEEVCTALSEFEGEEFKAIGEVNVQSLPKDVVRRILELTQGYKMIPIIYNADDLIIATIETEPTKIEYIRMKLKSSPYGKDKQVQIYRVLEQSFINKNKALRSYLNINVEGSRGIILSMVDRIKQAYRKAIALKATDLRFDILDSTISVSIEKFGKKIPLQFNIDYSLRDNLWRTFCSMAGVSHNSLMPGSWTDVAIDDIFQDGKYSSRISLLDTVRGVCITARIIPTENSAIPIEKLGLTPGNEMSLLKAVDYTAGIGYITGPMGSGKNTTAYSILERIVKRQRHTMSVEDPVEIRVEGINQVQVNLNSIDWENADQAIVRTMTKVLFVGETREGATARMSTRLANSSIMVISTLHVDVVAETISRLRGLTPEIDGLISSLQFLTNQRMLPRICPHCRKEVDIKSLPSYHQSLLRTYGYKGRVFIVNEAGCPHCINGLDLANVVIVMEILHFDYELKGEIYLKNTDLAKERVIKEIMFDRKQTIGHNALIHLNQGNVGLQSILENRLLELY